MAVAAHRGLYDPDRPVPVLTGTRCGACDRTFFPPVDIGCPACGATEDQLGSVDLAASGVLHAVATVHRHRVKGFDGPFAIAEIRLDEGPLVRATLDVAEHDVAIGQRMTARWVVARTDDEGNAVVEPRFAPASGGAEVGP